MALYKIEGYFKDGNGKAIVGGTGHVYLAGTTTLATIYSSASLTMDTDSPVSGSVITSDSNGKVICYVDDLTYGSDQTYKVVLSTPSTMPSYSITIDNIKPTIVLGTYLVIVPKTVSVFVRIPKGVVYSRGTALGAMTFTIRPEFGLYTVFSGFDAGQITIPGGLQAGTVTTTAPDVTATTKVGKVAIYDSTNTLIGYVQVYQGPGS